ncbi:hypothetical protein FRC07_009546 [Ceratobasidium sp. 392]|nr:hypothetical protein FRC07_009546 [Ceratobasidium sp. 392]
MAMLLIPPALPTFLAEMVELKSTVNIPSDEEVKSVHAAIRGLNNVASMPALYDADLAMRLSQHLFSVQMARYRDKYPCVIFPSNTTYTPPPLPAHIPITLEPVLGSPSDEHIKSVQAALRHSENLANLPSMFDADLSMKLSQHLFDIQFERYLREVAYGDRPAPVTTLQAEHATENRLEVASSGHIQDDDDESTRGHDEVGLPTVELSTLRSLDESVQAPSRDHVSPPENVIQGTLEQLEPIHSQTPYTPAEPPTNGLGDMTRLLVEIGDELKDVKRVMIASQQSMARGLGRTAWCDYGGWQFHHTIMNVKGEEPHLLGLPFPGVLIENMNNRLSSPGTISDMARYLQFYGIGEELLEEGEAPRLKDGKSGTAMAVLKSYLGM